MNTVRAVLVLLTLLALLLAGGFAIRGWLAPMPTCARRYRWRLLSWLAVGASQWLNLAATVPHTGAWNYIIFICVFLTATNGIERNWKAWEVARKREAEAERLRVQWEIELDEMKYSSRAVMADEDFIAERVAREYGR